MKIAFILDQFPSLSETFILNQITGLIDRGHEVDIYAEQPNQTSKIHPDVQKYKLLDRTYYPQRPGNLLWRIGKAIKLLIANFHKAPITLLSALNFFQHGHYALTLRLFYMAILCLDKAPYDIVQCHFGYFGTLGMSLREIGAVKGKLVTAFHGLDLTGYIQEKGEKCYNKLFQLGDLFLPISECFKTRLTQLGCPKNKIIVHHTGIDGEKFKFIPRQMENCQSVQLITVCRLVEKKGVEYAIRAVAKLIKDDFKIEYNIIGDGILKETLQKIIEELDVVNQVKLLGWKQQEEILEYFNDSHILLAPSVTGENGDREGIPVAIMEAMAMGLPVISTIHSGIPELVQDNVTGFLVPERDINALAERISYLVKHQERWPEIGLAGRIYVEEHFNINKLNDRLVELYQKLLNNS